ncbi:MAG: hypothetical protein KJ749_12990 [Planctomycetes bacterium]|nr:hypothetical protein [Planctomycetota bacterium]
MSSKRGSPSAGLAGYEVLVGVCGGIAAYKVCYVVSELVQRGAGVTVAMTEAATRFVGPVTFQALTGRRPAVNMWALGDREAVAHIERTQLADLMLIAPATANIIAKTAAGIADDLMSTIILSADSPVVLAPAMNDRMWANPVTQRNVAALRDTGYTFVGPAEGRLACGTAGVGRMLEPREILDVIIPMLEAKPAKAIGKVPGLSDV